MAQEPGTRDLEDRVAVGLMAGVGLGALFGIMLGVAIGSIVQMPLVGMAFGGGFGVIAGPVVALPLAIRPPRDRRP